MRGRACVRRILFGLAKLKNLIELRSVQTQPGRTRVRETVRRGEPLGIERGQKGGRSGQNRGGGKDEEVTRKLTGGGANGIQTGEARKIGVSRISRSSRSPVKGRDTETGERRKVRKK